jgi:two-component system response regulator
MTSAAALDVLVVEDDRDDAQLTLKALRRANVALRIALMDDGVSALDFLFRTGEHAMRAPGPPPRVVLVDLVLPKLGGVEVIRRIKSDARTRTVPVVVWTASRERRDIDEAYARGANSYVVKPADHAELVDVVGDVVRYWMQVNKP